ncbi:hypothetical protein BDW02DRAFT_621482 [Decorospora gaudefroyi]|uniref:DUF7726 domain-containing protein n=1 Tax=Decorospora gaudefroyi TaxID=184978 RepID=A0A6A5K9A8_9PLEO|nr:hypothetical protein BDW02DRAFT_621482 [Decorospora gaudefroyi]
MKVGEFQKLINITPNAYSRFMGQHGKDKGLESSVYIPAWAFFRRRELKGIKSKPNKKMKKDDGAAEGGKDSVPSVDDVRLEGEEEDKVEIFDTCDDIRKKINAHLKKPGVTQASFLRCASASFHTKPRKLTSAQLSAFRSKKGPYDGNMTGIYYGAYVYFEKLRIKEGKPESKKRLEMEEIHPYGMETGHRMDCLIVRKGDSWHHDAYGKVIVNRGSRS